MDLFALAQLPAKPFSAEDLSIIRNSDAYLSEYLFLEGNELVGEQQEKIHRLDVSFYRLCLPDAIVFTSDLTEALSILDHLTTA